MLLPVTRRAAPELVLDVVADFTCPWSFLGTRRIARALNAVQGLPATLRWHGFRVPRAPLAADGPAMSAWSAHLAQRLPPGVTVAFAERGLVEAGRDLGIGFRFDLIHAVPDTLHAHRLVLAAAAAGLHVRVADLLFSAYFEQGRDIGQADELISLGREAGLDAATLATYAAGFEVPPGNAQSAVAIVLAEEQRLRALGVQNVPNLLLNGHVLVPGPAAEAVYVHALDQALFPPVDPSEPARLH